MERRKSERRQLEQPMARELTQTYFDGIRKTLMWLVDSKDTFVRVEDERLKQRYVVDVKPGENPLYTLAHACAQSPFAPPKLGHGQPDGQEARV